MLGYVQAFFFGTYHLSFSFQAPGCSQSAGAPPTGPGPVHLWCSVATWCWRLPRLHHAPFAPQRHPALELPGWDCPPLQGVLATAERTRPPNPTRSADPGWPVVLKPIQGDRAAGAGTTRPTGAGGGAGHQGGLFSPREPLGEKKPQLRWGLHTLTSQILLDSLTMNNIQWYILPMLIPLNLKSNQTFSGAFVLLHAYTEHGICTGEYNPEFLEV